MVVAEPGQRRKLEAILSADVVGYSRLMQDDDAATVETLTRYRTIFSDFVGRHEGRIVDSPGDNILAEFDSPVEAVQCAVELQREFARRNRQLAEHRQMQFRIGINLGDILSRDDGTIYGDGVNVAARLEALAEPGGIMISESARMQVRTLIDVGIADAGEHEVKNIAEPVHVYRIMLDETTPEPRVSRKVPRATIAIVAAAALVIAIFAGFGLWSRGEPETAEVAETPADPILAIPTGPRIAVLPFENLSGTPDEDYFSNGIAEEIITALTQFRDLFVIARNSSFQFKDQARDVRTIGKELGVNYIVEGSVRRAQGTIRVTAKLTEIETGAHLWAQTYERDLTVGNIFAVQDEITEQVVARIAGSYGVITRAGLRASEHKSTDSLDAYECVLHARQWFGTEISEEFPSARECMERAVVLDPGYAEAWAWLALLNGRQFGYALDGPSQPPPLDRALDAAHRAIKLEPESAMAYFALASAHFFRKEMVLFRQASETALALNPNNALVLAELGGLLGYAGELERCLAMTAKAMKLNPHYPGWYYAGVFNSYYHQKNYAEALLAAQRWNEPYQYWNQVHLAQAYAFLGDEGSARAAITKLLELRPDFADVAREEIQNWGNSDEFVEHELDGLRKAGLEIPDAPLAGD